MPQIIPMQPVRHLPRAIAFYEKLGFTIEDRRDDWGWAKLRWGDCQVMLDPSIKRWAGWTLTMGKPGDRLRPSFMQ